MVEGHNGAEKQKNVGSYLNYSRFTVFMAAVALALLVFTAVSTKNSEMTKLHKYALGQLNTYNRNLLDMLNIYETFPKLLSERPTVIEFVRHPGRAANINDYLLRFNDSAGSESTYVMNADGIVIATSNFKKPQSLLGKDLRFREYFRSAIKGTPFRFVAVGVYTKTPGYYVSYPIRSGRQIIGVVVVKYLIQLFTLHNAGHDEIFMLVDRNGIIFHSSDKRYTFNSLVKLPDNVLKEIKDIRQYENIPLLPLPIIKKSQNSGITTVTLGQPAQSKSDNQTKETQYVEARAQNKDADWTMIFLVSTASVTKDIINHCSYVLLAMVVVYLIGIFALYRAKSKGTLLSSYNDLLEQKKETETHVKEQEIIKSILNVSLSSDSLEVLLQKILELILLNPWISLQAKGCIFINDEDSGELKIVASQNFREDQLVVCSPLPYGKCLCGQAASTRDIVFSQDDETDEKHTVKYDSIAPHGHYCVPIISGDRLLGVFNVYLNKGHERKKDDDVFLKTIARTIAGVVIRKEAEEKINQSFLIQNVINSILQLSIQFLSLKEYLEKFLELISTVPWLSTKSTGCIFLIGNDPDELEMAVHRGLAPQLLHLCRRVRMGSCLCGQSASTGKVIFTSAMDAQHEVNYEGIGAHGHYCVPVKVEGRVIGVINLYVEEGHERTALEEDFLVSAANTLSGIIERKRMEEKLEYMANNDALTGLPNRILFFDRLGHEIKSSTRYGYMLGVLYIDIDNFKLINDTMGHDAGDKLIKSIADRLLKSIRESDTVSRMSGDEFTVILSNVSNVNQIETVSNKLLASLKEPYDVNGQTHTLTASIGISVFPSDSNSAGELLKHADTAMSHAKNAGKDICLLFNPEMDEALNQRIALEKELRFAIERDELVVHYQPQIDISTGRIIGAEALVRWQHPQKGLLYPDKFITIAEDTGLIIPLGEQVLYKSCKQNIAWQNEGLPPIVVAVNVSTTQISWNYDLADMVFDVLDKTKMPPGYLELEITESFCMQNVDSTVSMLHRFNAKGIQVAIDDFGTGYSSLSYLKHLPFKKLKVDRSFVNEITKNQDDLTIVKTIIDMSHNLRLKVIAEGVETAEQLEILRALGCDEVQGYLFSKPVTAEKFAALLKDEGG
ncbi:EAL domain-containing protein [Candidatus Magnetominusculus dajiuhuensis]|uniref:EAL domain-containing protein n=1 Tax=Candidatus Magnetominusculus dajiuhuensis TaxID=3137712 RepID=UPI003B436652